MAGLADALFWTALIAGMVLRIARYVDNRSLWLDESFLALNLLDKSPGELLGSLEYAQSAPPAFLLLEKGTISLLGDSEPALRLFPLLSSLAAVAVFALLARQLLSPLGATLALVLFAMNDSVLFQASETKQYSSDLLIAVALLALLTKFGRGPATLSRLVPLLVVGAIAPLVSFPAVLVLAGVGLAALLLLHRSGRRRDLVIAASLMGSWVAAFGVVLAVSSRTVQRVSDEVFGGPSSTTHDLSSVIELSWSVFVNPGGFSDGTNALAALLAAFGFIEIVRRGHVWLVVAVGTTAVAAFAAGVLERYPIGNRYSTFLVPIVIVLVVYGVDALVRDSRRGLLLASALVVVIVTPQLATATRHALSPPRPEDVRPLLETGADGWRKGDVLYVYRNAQYAFRYYGARDHGPPGGKAWPWPIRPAPSSGSGEQFAPALESVPPTVIVGTQEPLPDRIASDLERLPRRGRLWILLSHVSGHNGVSDGALLRRELDTRGHIAGAWSSGTADLLLYDLG